jgi:hypothetical protein
MATWSPRAASPAPDGGSTPAGSGPVAPATAAARHTGRQVTIEHAHGLARRAVDGSDRAASVRIARGSGDALAATAGIVADAGDAADRARHAAHRDADRRPRAAVGLAVVARAVGGARHPGNAHPAHAELVAREAAGARSSGGLPLRLDTDEIVARAVEHASNARIAGRAGSAAGITDRAVGEPAHEDASRTARRAVDLGPGTVVARVTAAPGHRAALDPAVARPRGLVSRRARRRQQGRHQRRPTSGRRDHPPRIAQRRGRAPEGRSAPTWRTMELWDTSAPSVG